VSGIAAFYKPEELRGRLLVVCCNLKKAQVKGVLSEGMVLTAVTGDDADRRISLLAVPAGATPGAAVMPPDTVYSREQAKEYNMRKWDALELRVNEDKRIECAGAALEQQETAIVDKKLKSDFTAKMNKSKEKTGAAAASSDDNAELAAKKKAAALEREARLKQIDDHHARRYILCVNGNDAEPISVDKSDEFVGAKVK
jgi:tRNA-binding EMAP/Myf-like protein